MHSTGHSLPQAAVLFSHLANKARATNMPSANDSAYRFFETFGSSLG